MAAGYIQLPPDSTGKLVQGWHNTIGSDDVYTQAHVPTHTTGVELTTATGVIVGGGVAHDDADTGNPVKIGGKANDSYPTSVANGDRVNAWFGTNGQIVACAFTPSTGADAHSNFLVGAANGQTGSTSVAQAAGMVFNGSTWDRQRGDTTGLWVQGQGGVAHDSPDSGSPVKIGGKAYSSTPTSVADADRVNGWFDLMGRLVVSVAGIAATGGDGISTSLQSAILGPSDSGTANRVAMTAGHLFNGSTWDRIRGNTNGQFVQGNVAHDITDAGNPIKIGGKAGSSGFPTQVASNDRVDALFDRYGHQTVVTGDSAVGVDAKGNSSLVMAYGHDATVGGLLTVAPSVYNGTTWDRLRGDTNGLYVGGNVAHDSPDAGNPIKTGGKAIVGPPSNVNANDRVNAWFTLSGIQVVSVFEGGTPGVAADAISNTNIQKVIGSDNTLTTAYFGQFPFVYNGSTWDRLRTIESVSAAPNVKTGIQAVGIGPGFDVKLNPSNLGTAVNSAITNTVDGANTIAYYIGTTTTGSLRFEATYDDSTWTDIDAFYYSVNNPLGGIWASGDQTPTTGRVYVVDVGYARQVRVRTTATLGATVSVRTKHSLRQLTQHVALFGGPSGNAGVASTLADATDNTSPSSLRTTSFLMGYNGSTWDRVRTANTGRLQVDVITGGGGGTQYVEDVAFSGNGTGTLMIARRDDALATLTPVQDDAVGLRVNDRGALWVGIADASGNQITTFGGADTPTTPVNSYDTTANVAATSSDNHDTADLGGLTRKCAKVIFGATVPLKVELQTVENGSVVATLAVGFSPAGGMGELVPSHRDYWSEPFSANGGFDGFRLVRTNLDATQTADVYSTIQYEA